MPPKPGEVSLLLNEIKAGSPCAEDKLLELVYAELHQIAAHYLRRERAGHTLQATALVNEAYLRLVEVHPDALADRTHFFALASRVMRRVLVDYARTKCAKKRGGQQFQLEIDEAMLISVQRSEEFIELDQALDELATWDPRQARIVELKFFGGLTDQEIAETLGVSTRTVKRDWMMARAWLQSKMGP